MKHTIALISSLLILCISIFSCATTKNSILPPIGPTDIDQAPQEQPRGAQVQTIQKFKKVKPIEIMEKKMPVWKAFTNIKTSTNAFNPSLKEEVAIFFDLLQEALVTLNIYDPDNGLIKTIDDGKWKKPVTQSFVWNGKDMDGKVVADEAYYFTLEIKTKAGQREIYDPTVFSGGIEGDITKADIDRQNHTVNYRLPEPARVLIRIGIQSGPLLNTLVDWQPRVAGAITEYWNGKDQDDLINAFDHPRFKMIITYFTLPENSIITYGNKKTCFREYKKALNTKRPLKPNRTRSIGSQKVSHHFHRLRTNDYSPKVLMTFPHLSDMGPDDMPVLKDKTIVRIELADKDIKYFTEQQYEITFFLDTEFYAEEEVGYSPFNWIWDLTDVEPGDHILTVNLSSFQDQIGVLSRKITILE